MQDTCCTAAQLALLGIDQVSVLKAFGWGFGSVFTAWTWGVIGEAIRRAVRDS